jgi:hypothetical protein
MFKKLLSIFNKTRNQEKNKFVAAIEICVTEDSSSQPVLNILLDDENPKCISGLCQILTLCSHESFFANVVQVVRNQFADSNRTEDLEKIILHLATLDLFTRVKDIQKQQEDPYIKPSDIEI